MSGRVRLPHVDELPTLNRIELAAAARFAEVGMPEMVTFPTVPLQAFQIQHAQGLLLVIDQPVTGFALTDLWDGCLYLVELDVHPASSGGGRGRLLLQGVMELARERSLPWVTLSTFRDVPWNAPFYARVGFEIVEPATLGLRHVAQRHEEQENGLDVSRRVMMRRSVVTAG